MNEFTDVDPEALLQKYRTKGVLIDTNLLVLLVVGIYNQNRIRTFKRTYQYTLEDFTLVNTLVNYFERRITTPNILTEVDNLSRQLPANDHDGIRGALSALISTQFEVYVPSENMIQQARYSKIGLTDSVTIAATEGILVVTDDARLATFLYGLARDVININHIRSL